MLLLPLSGFSQNLLLHGRAGKENNKWTGVKLYEKCSYDGKDCFEVCGSSISDELVPLEEGKKYRISGWFNKAANADEVNFLLGLVPYDKNKIRINESEVNPVKQTETILAAPCKAADTSLKIKDGRKWLPGAIYLVAFDVDDSGSHADLPNRNLSSVGVAKVAESGDCWQVELAKSCGRDFPAGTKIREHSLGSKFMYPVHVKSAETTWKEYSGVITAVREVGTPSDKLFVGTKYVSPGIVSLSGAGKVFFDDIRIEEIK